MHRLLTKLFSSALIIFSITTYAETVPSAEDSLNNPTAVTPLPAEGKLPKKTLTLDDAVYLALRYNPNVENAAISRVVQKFGLEVAKNQFELQYALTGSGQYTRTKAAGASSTGTNYTVNPSTSLNLASGGNVNLMMNNNINNPNGAANTSSYNPSLSLSVTQPLMRGFGPAVALSPLANAEDQEAINKLNLRQTIISTITKVVMDYRAIIQAKQNVLTQQVALKDVQKRIHDNLIKIRAGTIPPSDNVQAQADLAQAQLAIASAENNFTQSKLTLLNDIGLSPDQPLEIDSNITINGDQSLPTLEQIKNLVLVNDVTYQTALINKQIDKRQLLVARDNQRTQLNLVANGTTGGGAGSGPNANLVSLTNGQNQSSTIGLQLNVPIDDMPAQQAYLSAKAQTQQDEVNLRANHWQLETSAINALNNLKTLQQQLQLAQQAVDMQTKALDIAEKKFRYGMGSALDVSIQQKALTTAQLNFTSTQVTYLDTLLQFRQLIGKTLDDFHVVVHY